MQVRPRLRGIEMFVAKVEDGGRISIPKDVSTKLNVKEGSYIQVTV